MKSLILDDEKLTAQTIARMTSRLGCDAKFVDDPEGFFEIHEQWRPDVIVLDLKMPQMDGVEVIQKLAAMGTDAKLILASGGQPKLLELAEAAAREHGLSITGCLPKPFSSSVLAKIMADTRAEIDAPKPRTVEEASPRLPSADELEQALTAQTLQVFYQPKIDPGSGQLRGFEALSRWQHPELGFIPPDYFIPMAELSGLIDDLTQYVVSQSIAWLAQLSARADSLQTGRHRLNKATMSINLSAKSLSNRYLFEHLVNSCRLHNINPSRVILEITESTAMSYSTDTYDNLARLGIKGFGLSIDDFGTGYSSLSQLVKLPFTEIKVDKAFVLNARDNAQSRAVIRSVVELGKSLGMQTTAEGVEDRETQTFLRGIGCDLCQGYYISKPMDADTIFNWFVAHERELELKRVAALKSLKLDVTVSEERFDRFTRLAGEVLDTPIAMLNILDAETQRAKSNFGLSCALNLDRHDAICSSTIEEDQPLIIRDMKADPVFGKHPLLLDSPHIQFYAGSPVSCPDGNKLGALCVMDYQARSFNSHDQRKIELLSAAIDKEFADTGDNSQTEIMSSQAFIARFKEDIHVTAELGAAIGLLCVKAVGIDKLALAEGQTVAEQVLNNVASLLRQYSQVGLVGISRFGLITLSVIGYQAYGVQNTKQRLLPALREYLALSSKYGHYLDFAIACHRQVSDHEITVDSLVESAFINDSTIVSRSTLAA